MTTIRYRSGTGLALPPMVVRNPGLERRLGLEPGWIERRTGIRERRVAAEGTGVSELAIRAGHEALERAGVDPAAVGLLLLATSTPDRLLPPTAPLVAHELGIRGGAMDLAAACSGFVHALALAHGQLASGTDPSHPAVLVIGANILTRRVNADDPTTAPIFGDGAGALVLQRDDASGPTRVLATVARSDGEHQQLIHIPAGGSRLPLTPDLLADRAHTMRMEHGEQLFRVAVRAMADCADEALQQAGRTVADVDWLIPHQANARMVRRVAAELRVPFDRLVGNVDRVGNTSAASIPIALHEAVTDGRIQRGQTVLLTAAGSGLTAGAVLLEW